MKRVWKNKSILLGLIMVLIVALSAVFAEVLSPGNPVRIDMGHRFEAPSEIFPLGTDGFGRCVLSRLLYGARYSLGLAVLVMLILVFAVIPSAMAAAYKGGFMEKGFLWLCDISMALPPIVLVLAITGILGNGPINLLFSSFFSYFGWYGRMVRSHTLTELSKSYTTYAITGGSSAASLLGIQVFPNIAPNLLVLFCLGIGDMILMLSGYSFLGIGLAPGTPEWGAMLNEARSILTTAPQFALYPGVCILFTVCGFNLVGEGMRKATGMGEVING